MKYKLNYAKLDLDVKIFHVIVLTKSRKLETL